MCMFTTLSEVYEGTKFFTDPNFQKAVLSVLDEGTESDLVKLKAELGLAKVKSVFLDKMLNLEQLEDVKYEIAVAAMCALFVDKGSLSLELKKQGSRKNSDIAGKINGQKYRFEVTVIHDDWLVPSSVYCILEEANIPLPAGYIVDFLWPIRTERDATFYRGIIEKAYTHHQATPNSGFTIDALNFQPQEGSYTCFQSGKERFTIEFTSDSAKLAQFPAVTRSTIDEHEWDALADKPGVTLSSNVPPEQETHEDVPLSTKAHQILDRKRKQCETGYANIIVLGQPKPYDDKEVMQALFGAEYIKYKYSSRGVVCTIPTGPFIPACDSPDPEQHIRSFKIVSAVMVIRLSNQPKCYLIDNPNADIAIPSEVLQRIKYICDSRRNK
jgi:hypothetical protein